MLTRRPPPPDDAPPSSLAIPVDVDLAPPSAEPAETTEEKPRDSVPVVTSCEADDDIDAILAAEDVLVPTTFATEPPADPNEPMVPATDESQKKATLPPLPDAARRRMLKRK